MTVGLTGNKNNEENLIISLAKRGIFFIVFLPIIDIARNWTYEVKLFEINGWTMTLNFLFLIIIFFFLFIDLIVNIRLNCYMDHISDVENESFDYIKLFLNITICLTISVITYVLIEMVMHCLDMDSLVPVELDFNYRQNILTYVCKGILIITIIICIINNHKIINKTHFVWRG